MSTPPTTPTKLTPLRQASSDSTGVVRPRHLLHLYSTPVDLVPLRLLNNVDHAKAIRASDEADAEYRKKARRG